MRLTFVGGTRFIGRAAAIEALARGHEVVLLHRGKHACDVPGARDVVVDRGHPGALAHALSTQKPDAVVDTRAMNMSDAETTVLALAIAPAPCVVLSSQDVYAAWGPLLGYGGPQPAEELTEGSPMMTVRFPYRGKEHDGGDDYDKKDVEEVFRRAALQTLPSVCVLRLPAVYGRRDYRRRFGAIVDALDRGDDVPCAGGAMFRWTHAHVRDVAHAIVLAAEKARPGFSLYNVGEATTPTMHDRVEAIARAAVRAVRWRETPEPLPDAFAVLGRVPASEVVSSAKIRAELGYTEITSPDERVNDLVAWCRETRTTMSA